MADTFIDNQPREDILYDGWCEVVEYALCSTRAYSFQPVDFMETPIYHQDISDVQFLSDINDPADKHCLRLLLNNDSSLFIQVGV
jgi:hypothetical protein